ncbi:hypothetical protein [Polyangium fumosum]|uniref:Uncharacterized protein n=1 Tax=Polyangium fumosum TaxID=889272 RepID=A0A4U1J261_9BACT|nr:hypothetical protein [Polyangium fumosum]TKD01186.1 hypothetical protein E8A74_31800 [Polyangium fumosum]
MLSPHVRFEGFTATDWVRVLSLFRPRRTTGELRDPNRPRGGVIAIHDHGRLRKLLHTTVGRLGTGDITWPMTAEELAKRHEASFCIVLESGTLERIMERFASRARKGDDLATQTLTLFSLAQAELAAGRLSAWPLRLRGVPIPTPGMVRTSLDAVCPIGKALVLGIFEGGELWTSVALRRGQDGISLILGPDEIRGDMGLLSGDWRRDYRHLSHAIEDRVGPIAFGCYAETASFRALEVDPSPGAWARAAFVRDIILSPLPAPMAIPLGIDASRAAFLAMRKVMERVDSNGVVAGSIERLWDRAAKSAQHGELEEMLGFHPLELLRKLLVRED